jgi:CHASE3 domain sensor protein
MKEPTWEQEKEKRREETLERHARLHKLFKEDRLAFERERKEAIQALINSVKDEDLRNRLQEMQNQWDKRMRGAGSASNRFVLAQAFFWDHFHNVWNPKMQELSLLLNRKPG